MKSSDPKSSPPRWATRLLQWYCAPHLIEEVQGDLQEEFDYQVKQVGSRRAQLDYVRNVIGFIRPFAIKRGKSHTSNPFTMNMLRHYTTIAFRNMVRQKTFSMINIVGLALGMTCCLFIFLWVQDEKAVDNFHAHGRRLYNLYQTTSSRGNVSGNYSTPFTLLYRNLNLKKGEVPDAIRLEDIQQVVPEVLKINSYATG